MKRQSLFVLLAILLSTAFLLQAKHINLKPYWAKATPYLPQTLILYRNGYIMGYDGRNRSPLWVYEKVSLASLQGNEERVDFYEDEEIPLTIRALLSDYKGSGYDRGHLAPAGNHTLKPEEMEDSFALSNICPQHPTCNRGLWRSLEEKVRELAASYSVLHVLTGTAYEPQTAEDGSRYMHYRVIGSSDIGVPTHLWKVIHALRNDGEEDTFVYIVPNDESVRGKSFEEYQTTLDKVERISGLVLAR